MAKRGRPEKPPEEKYILKTFKFPPDLWEAFCAVVPEKERSAKLRSYMEKEIRKSKRSTS